MFTQLQQTYRYMSYPQRSISQVRECAQHQVLVSLQCMKKQTTYESQTQTQNQEECHEEINSNDPPLESDIGMTDTESDTGLSLEDRIACLRIEQTPDRLEKVVSHTTWHYCLQ